jgi:hypothetical protein
MEVLGWGQFLMGEVRLHAEGPTVVLGRGRFLMSEVPLYRTGAAPSRPGFKSNLNQHLGLGF